MPLVRRCSTCGQEFPATAVFWHKTGQGLQSRCKQCACADAREWYAQHPERVRVNHENSSAKRSAKRVEQRRIKEAAFVAPTHRACNVCLHEFPRTAEFWNMQPRRTDGLDETCKVCAKKRARDWYLANRERASTIRKEYREKNDKQVRERKAEYRAANLEKIRASQRALRAANPEKHRASNNKYRIHHPEKVAAKKRADYLANPAAAKQRAREWLKANPEQTKLRTARRRAAVKNAPGQFAREDLTRQFQMQEGRCFYCLEDLEGIGTVDHDIPLSKGGTNYPTNIVLACWPCNNSKRARLPSEFRPK